MRLKARVAGLSVVAAILIVPLAAQAGSLRTDDAPPLDENGCDDGRLSRRAADRSGRDDHRARRARAEGAAEVEAEAAGEGDHRCRRRRSLRLRLRRRPSALRRLPLRPPSPRRTLATSRGGASSPVVVPSPARGGPSFTEPVVRSRETASVTAVLASPPNVAKPHSAGVSRALIAVLGAAAFAEALLITRITSPPQTRERLRASDLRTLGPGR